MTAPRAHATAIAGTGRATHPPCAARRANPRSRAVAALPVALALLVVLPLLLASADAFAQAADLPLFNSHPAAGGGQT